MRLIGLIVGAVLMASSARAEPPRVVADVAPIHSLVAQVMEGVNEPELLIPALASPHSHALKFSDAKRLSQAEIVFWVGESLTPWLEKALHTRASNALTVELLEVDGLTLLANDDDDHAHAGYHDQVDPHIWLDPDNAIILVEAIARTLAEADAENAALYTANAKTARTRLIKQKGIIEKLMNPAKGSRYIVLHDGYRYFEERFDLGRAYVIADSHAASPGAKRITEIRRIAKESNARCIFGEFQLEHRTIDAIARGTDIQSISLDPMGFHAKPGPDLYSQVMESIARAMADCLR